MRALIAVAVTIVFAVGLVPAYANCGPAHPCQGAYCHQ